MPRARLYLGCLLAFAFAFVGSGSVGASPAPWQHVVTRGLGSAGNTYLLDTAAYKGYLYVATAANPQTKLWSGVAKSGGDVWRTRDGVSWQRVGRAGLGNANNLRIAQLIVFKDRLYALTGNAVQGIEVWVSTGGQFRPVKRGGFGDAANHEPIAWLYAGKLIVGTNNQRGAQMWVSSDGTHFQRAKAPGLRTGNNGLLGTRGSDEEGVVFGGHIYAGTSSLKAGGELWRSVEGMRWERVATGGLGRRANIVLEPQVVFKKRLYVVSVHQVSTTRYGGIDVFRTSDGTSYERVVTNGFGSKPDENIIGQLAVFKTHLYLALYNMDPRVLTPGRPRERFQPQGFELWRTSDGSKWTQIEGSGFGNRGNHAAVVQPLGDRLGLVAFNYRNGDSLWSSSSGVTWTQIWREGKPTPYGQGGGFFPYAGHIYISTNDLARGVDIWRSTGSDITP